MSAINDGFRPVGEAVVVTITSTVDLTVNFGGYSKLFVQAQGGDARYSLGNNDPGTTLFILTMNDARVFDVPRKNLKFKGTTLVVQPGE